VNIKFFIDYKEKKYASGTLIFLSENNILHETKAYSGAKLASEKNNGALPEGEYKVVSMRYTDKESFVYDGVGWIVGLIPQFETERFDLALHPDGGIEGSAGCIVGKWLKEESIKIYNLIRDGFDNGTLFLDVMFTGRQR
jgi:hypothetical protein